MIEFNWDAAPTNFVFSGVTVGRRAQRKTSLLFFFPASKRAGPAHTAHSSWVTSFQWLQLRLCILKGCS
jgi:transposase-like protein